MTILTRIAVSQDYKTLSNIFYEASMDYQGMRPDFYRPINSLPPKWQFDFMLAAKKWGKFKDIEMIVATNENNNPIGAIYMESIKRTSRSWSAFEKTAWIETLVTSSTVADPDKKAELQNVLIAAGINWARATGHPYTSFTDAIYKLCHWN